MAEATPSAEVCPRRRRKRHGSAVKRNRNAVRRLLQPELAERRRSAVLKLAANFLRSTLSQSAD